MLQLLLRHFFLFIFHLNVYSMDGSIKRNLLTSLINRITMPTSIRVHSFVVIVLLFVILYVQQLHFVVELSPEELEHSDALTVVQVRLVSSVFLPIDRYRLVILLDSLLLQNYHHHLFLVFLPVSPLLQSYRHRLFLVFLPVSPLLQSYRRHLFLVFLLVSPLLQSYRHHLFLAFLYLG